MSQPLECCSEVRRTGADPLPTGEDRVEAFRCGDPEAIAAVARLARHMVGEKGYYVLPDDREDLVQEILIHVHRAVSGPGFRLRSGFDGLVRSVAHRRCVDWMRRHKRGADEPASVAAAPPDPEKVLLSQERIERGLHVLRNLGWACREIIRMRIGEGLRYRQIAERLDRTEESVRSHMYKCLKRAKQIVSAGESRHGGLPSEAGER